MEDARLAIDYRGRARAIPVESGLFPLAHGLPRGMGNLPTGLRELADVAGFGNNDLRAAKRFRSGALNAYGNALELRHVTAFLDAVVKLRYDSVIGGCTGSEV